MFLTEEHVKQDASTLLFLLIFHDFIEGSPLKSDFSLPFLVFKRLNIPFTCKTHGKMSKYSQSDSSGETSSCVLSMQ